VFFTPSSETRDDIGISAVAIEDIPDAAYSYHVVRLRLKEDWDLLFRTYAFKTRAFLDQAETLCDGSGTRYVISQGKFRSMTLKVPPVPEQTAIAAVLSDMDAEIGALERRLAKTRALKQGMMQELLTGKTRLTVS
jgi:type I restriction enzyme S subunit